MKVSRREQKHANMIDEIKAHARKLMAEQGTSGLSIRAIAREMDMTSAALYYYVANLDDLINQLSIDAFHDLNASTRAQLEKAGNIPAIEQLRLIGLAYRDWALTNPVDFQLVYGNPIPSYQQATDITYPPARAGFALLAQAVAQAIDEGDFFVDSLYMDLPPQLKKSLADLAELEGHHYPAHVLYIAASLWSKFHGMVSLELYNLIQPVIGDTQAFYQHEIEILLGSFSAKNRG